MTDIGLKIRENIIYIDDEFTSNKPKNLERCVLVLKDEKKVDIGAMCYRVFDTRTKDRNNNLRYIWGTETDTLDKGRYDFVSNLIDKLRLDTQSKSVTKRHTVRNIARFIHWIGKDNDLKVDFSDSESIKNAYIEYTKFLIHRKELKDGEDGKIKNNSASALQKMARLACSLITGTSLKAIEYWAAPIRHDDKDSFSITLTHNPLTDKTRFETFAGLCQAIHDAWELLVKQNKENIQTSCCIIDASSMLYDVRKLDEYYNKIVVAAAMTFISATGANLQVAVDSVIDSYEYQPTSKGLRASGVKARAKGKVVYPEFSARYKSVWEKWTDIRTLWLARMGLTSYYAFPYLGQSNSVRGVPAARLGSDSSQAKFFTKHYDVVWMGARAWRGFRSKLINKVTGGDILTAAEMQDHTVGTALRHYTNRDLAEAAREISSVLDLIYEAAIQRTRYKKHVDVLVVNRQDPKKETPVGECSSGKVLAPTLAEGFTSYAPKPDCSVKETCIFCDKYVVHADEEDIRKLLSLRYLIEELKPNMPSDDWANRWSPYIYRIDEVLCEIESKRPSLSSVTKMVKEEVEFGILDNFWKDYHETLYYLGMVS